MVTRGTFICVCGDVICFYDIIYLSKREKRISTKEVFTVGFPFDIKTSLAFETTCTDANESASLSRNAEMRFYQQPHFRTYLRETANFCRFRQTIYEKNVPLYTKNGLNAAGLHS